MGLAYREMMQHAQRSWGLKELGKLKEPKGRKTKGHRIARLQGARRELGSWDRRVSDRRANSRMAEL